MTFFLLFPQRATTYDNHNIIVVVFLKRQKKKTLFFDICVNALCVVKGRALFHSELTISHSLYRSALCSVVSLRLLI